MQIFENSTTDLDLSLLCNDHVCAGETEKPYDRKTMDNGFKSVHMLSYFSFLINKWERIVMVNQFWDPDPFNFQFTP